MDFAFAFATCGSIWFSSHHAASPKIEHVAAELAFRIPLVNPATGRPTPTWVVGGVIDRIVAEPVGGAHREPVQAIANLGAAIGEELDALSGLEPQALRTDRADKFLAIGV